MAGSEVLVNLYNSASIL